MSIIRDNKNKPTYLGSFITPELARDFYILNVDRLKNNKPLITKKIIKQLNNNQD